MTDTYERAIKEAEEWLISAKDKIILAEEEESASAVCCALAIHAIIRANDALALKFLGHKSTRHDDASALFSKILQQNKIPSESSRFLRLIQKAMIDKSGADYGKKTFDYECAKEYVDETEEFVLTVRNYMK